MRLKKTTEDFIIDAKSVHGSRYGYDVVDYKGSAKKIPIWCSKHGYFYQRPNDHLSGKGCMKCGKEAMGNIQNDKGRNKFIAQSIEIHGDLYNYENTEYKKAHDKVNIWCNKHNGYFSQRPYSHLQGHGCSVCKRQRSKAQVFITEAIKSRYNIDVQVEKKPLFLEGLEYDISFKTPDNIMIAIEYDGEQHFRPTRWSSAMTEKQAEMSLEQIKKRDKRKNQLSVENSVELFRISYFEYNSDRENTLNRLFSKLDDIINIESTVNLRE